MVTRFQESKLTGPAVTRPSQEVSRILTAAVISAQFRQMLLNNPDKAIAAGFGGESFHLPREEKTRLASIRATSLADFASQVRAMETGYLSSSLGIGD